MKASWRLHIPPHPQVSQQVYDQGNAARPRPDAALLFSHSLGICSGTIKRLRNKCLSHIWKQMLGKLVADFASYVGEFFVCDTEWETGQMISKQHHWNILTPWNTYFQREILNTVEFVFPPLWCKENIFLFSPLPLLIFKKTTEKKPCVFSE